MPEFPIIDARQELGFTPSVGARLDVDVSGTGGVGAAIGQALLTGAEIFREYDINQANVEFSQFKNIAKREITELEIRRASNLDPDTYKKDLEDTLARIKTNIPERGRSARASNLWLGGQIPTWQKDSIDAQFARSEDNWLTELSLAVAGVAKTGNPEELVEIEKTIARKQLGPSPLDKSEAAKLLVKARESQVEGELAILKQRGFAGDAEAFNDARALVQRSGTVFDSTETLDELRGIEILERLTLSKTKDLRQIKNLKVNEDFIPRLIDKTLSPDDVKESILPNIPSVREGVILVKRDWTEYINRSTEPSPTETTPEGMEVMLSAVIGFGKRETNKEQAYKDLLDTRYLDRLITDAEFNLGIRRIQEPYPRQITADVEAVTANVTKTMRNRGFNFAFPKRDREKAKDTNIEFLAWIESEIAQDKEPTRDEMYNKSAELIAQTPQKPLEDKSEVSELSDDELLKRIIK